RPGGEPLEELQRRWKALHLRRKRRSSLPDVRPRDRLRYKTGQDDGVARPPRDRDAATGCLGDLRGGGPGKLGATRRSVVSDDELVCRSAPTRGSRPGRSCWTAVLPTLPVQAGRRTGSATRDHG